MKRFMVFAILFPPLAFVVTFWGILQVLNGTLGEPNTVDYHQMVLIPMAYVTAMVPALLTAWADDILAKRNARYRVLWTGLAGYTLIFIPLLAALSAGFVHGPYLLLFGSIGAIPAMICSWLAS